MKKKPIVYLLLFSFMLTILLPVSTPAATQSFSDISTHWAKDYISQLASSGYIKGYTDGKFKPDNTMTKAEFTRVLIAALGSTAADETTNSFSDIKKHWAKASINEAVKLGILVTSEDPNGFRPDEGIMRSQAAAMLVRALGKDPDSTPVSFKDRLTVEKSDYKGYIKTASDLGLISGFPDGNFEPFTTMTRAQVCTVIVKFLNQLNGTSGNLAASSTTPVTGGINTIVVGEQSYNIGTTPIYFNIEFQDIRASSISSGTGSFKLNGLHTIDLNSESKNPDITVNNIRYGIKKFAVTGNNLIAYTDCRKINKIIIDQRTYKSDYVELYVNAATTDYFLSDLGIVDANTVKLKSDTYKLNKERISISLDNEQYFYDIEKISLGDTDTQPVLEECDPLVVKGLSRSDIAAIFSGYTTLDLYDLDDMAFIIDGEKYTFDKVELDASGNFIVDEENFPVDKVIITKDDLKYDINKIIMDNGKFIFYCDEGTEHNWVIIDDDYYDADDVKIIFNSTIYDFDDIIVAKRNTIRIGTKQYEVDDNFKCKINDKVYFIDDIEYNRELGLDVIETGDTTSSSLTNQPDTYIFYVNDRKYQEDLDDVTIKANGKWLDFEDVTILDPTHFNYDSSEYDLIEAKIKIEDDEFKVEDTAWHGVDQTLDIYLEEI